jgi:putative Mg2+ transporter-C (MgtC) family protein
MKVVDPIVKLFSEEVQQILSGLNIWSILIRLLLAFIIAGIIGLERAARKQAAGLRTYILVGISSAMIMITSQFLIESYGTGDPARFGAGVLSGIGFLGAGTIMFTSKSQVKGLTTAAGIWAVACIGLCVGCGFYTIALIVFALILLALKFLPKIENVFIAKRGYFEIHIEFEQRANLKEFIGLVREKGLKIISIEHNPAYSNSGLSVYTIVISTTKKVKTIDRKQFLDWAKDLPYVEYVEEF